MITVTHCKHSYFCVHKVVRRHYSGEFSAIQWRIEKRGRRPLLASAFCQQVAFLPFKMCEVHLRRWWYSGAENAGVENAGADSRGIV